MLCVFVGNIMIILTLSNRDETNKCKLVVIKIRTGYLTNPITSCYIV